MTKKISIEQAVEEVEYMIDHCLPKERKSVTDFRVARLRRAIEIMRWTQENEPVIRQWHADKTKKETTVVCNLTEEELLSLRERPLRVFLNVDGCQIEGVVSVMGEKDEKASKAA